MPTHKVKGGYKWGKTGKVYPTKKQADKQGQAIYASGWNKNQIKEEQMKQNITLSESELHQLIKESVREVLLEKRGINSPKLYDIIQQHKGIISNRGIFDLNNMTDDDIIDVVDWKQLNDYLNVDKKEYDLGIADDIDYIPLKDGKYIIAKCRGARFDRVCKQYNDNREKLPGDFEDLCRKSELRHKNRYPRKDDYVWNNKDAEDLFKNPYFRNGDGNWTPERKKEVMSKLKK